MQEQKTFYKNLYTTKINKTESYIESENSFFHDNNMPTLSEMDKDTCEIDITLEECSKA